MQPVFSIDKKDAQKFSQVWNYKGLAVPLLDAHVQFATDFANIVLKNFVIQCQQQALVAKQQAEKKLIVE